MTSDPALTQQEWYAPISEGGISGLTIKDNRLYLGAISGKLYCLDAEDGDILWQSEQIDKTADTGLSSTPLVVGDTVYVTTQMPAALWAFSADDGAELYNSTIQSTESCVALLSSPSTDGTLIFSAGAYGITAYNPVSNTNKWTFSLTEKAGTPVYADGTVFFETETHLYSVNAETGEQNWCVEHTGFATSPAVKGDIIVANGQNGLTAYSVDEGKHLWTHTPNAETVIDLHNEATWVDYYDVQGISISPNSPIIAGDIAYYTANVLYFPEPEDWDYDGVPDEILTYTYSCVYGVSLADGTEPVVTATVSEEAGNYHVGEFSIHPYSGAVSGGNITFASPVISHNLLFLGLGIAPDITLQYQLGSGRLSGFGVPGKLTEYLYNGEVIVPPSLTTTVSGTTAAYASPAGLLSEVAEQNGKTITIENGMLTAYGDVANSGDAQWRMQINGVAGSDITASVSDGDRVLFYYGTAEKVSDADYAVKMTADVLDTFAEITIQPDYKRIFTPGDKSSATLSAVITDWEGNTITPQNSEIVWTASNAGAFDISTNGAALTYTPKGNTGDSTVFTATYKPANGNGASISVDTESVSIFERVSPIPSDPSIEETQTYFTWKGNYARTGVVNGDGPTTNSILWDVELPVIGGSHISLVDGSPVVHDGRVYVSVWSGGMAPEGLEVGVFCFDAETGEEIWQNEKYQSRAGITISGDKLYVSGGSRLVCLNLEDGSCVWETGVISDYPDVGLTGTPIVHNGVVYVTTTSLIKTSKTTGYIENYLYGFDAATGEQITRISAQAADGGNGGIGMFASPSMSPDGVLYVPGAGGVFAVDTATNAKLWEYDSGARSTSEQGLSNPIAIEGGNDMYVGSPVYKDQCVYFIRGGNEQTPTSLYCIDAVTGELIRKHDIDSTPITPVITDDKVITLGAILSDPNSGGGASAYNLTTGELLWHFEASGTSRASPIVAGDIAYFGTYKEGTLYAVNINTGKEVWHFKLPDAKSGWWNIIEATPAIENGILYIGGENGHFYAFKTDDTTPFNITGTQTVDVGIKGVFTTDTGRAYNWDFGDGTKTSGTAVTVEKSWDKAGVYNVTASIGSNKATFEVTVTEPPKALDETKPTTSATIEVVTPETPEPGNPDTPAPAPVPDTVKTQPDEGEVTLTFSTDVVNQPEEGTEEPAPVPVVKVTEYQAVKTHDAEVTLNAEQYTIPPNTEKAVFLMEVQTVENVKDEHQLETMAKLVVRLNTTTEDADKIKFWRYINENPNPIPLQSVKGSTLFTSEETGITVEYTVYIPGFSTIVATVSDKTPAPAVKPSTDDNIGTGGSTIVSGINYVKINPGSGLITYTTNYHSYVGTYTFDKMTALGVLLASGNSVVTADRWDGVYVHAINGMEPASDTEGWMVRVNGISIGTMANNYPVSDGDRVEWYYSSHDGAPISESKKVYGFIIDTSLPEGTIPGAMPPVQQTPTASGLTPAPSTTILVGIPEGVEIIPMPDGTQSISIDTLITKANKDVKVTVTDNDITIQQPGIRITIPLLDVTWYGDLATAVISGMTAEVLPAPVTVPVGGHAI